MEIGKVVEAGPGVIGYFWQSNLAGQMIVIALLFFSLIAWTVMIGKYIELNRMRELNELFEDRLGKAGSVLQAAMNGEIKGTGPFADLVRGVVDAYCQSRSVGKGNKSVLVGQVETSLQRAVARQSAAYESKMVMLSSIVSGAPFLGLLGTVWGVMDAFGQMGIAASASLQQLAPGVSGALLTTVAALLVAIPSVFGYNYLLSKTKRMMIELENFASVVADRVELELE